MDVLTTQTLSGVQTSIEVAGTVAFALSGVMAAARKKLDAVGVCAVASVAAFGGGTLRDVLLDRRPLFWIEQSWYLWTVLALCLAAMLMMRAKHFKPTEKSMQWPDALGLGLFAASGTQIALGMQMPALIAVLMGVITATFGGVLRDIVCNEIPVSFKDHRPYALCSVAGGAVYILLDAVDSEAWFCMTVCAVVTVVFRALSIVNNWILPAWRKD